MYKTNLLISCLVWLKKTMANKIVFHPSFNTFYHPYDLSSILK